MKEKIHTIFQYLSDHEIEKMKVELPFQESKINLWRNGNILPTINEIEIISKYFNCSIDEIIEEESFPSIFLKLCRQQIHSLDNNVKINNDTYNYSFYIFGTQNFLCEEKIFCNNKLLWSLSLYAQSVKIDVFNKEIYIKFLNLFNSKFPFYGKEYYSLNNYTIIRTYNNYSNNLSGFDTIYFDNKKIGIIHFIGSKEIG